MLALHAAAAPPDPERGQRIAAAAGCEACHTQDTPWAGGVAIETGFGTFYGTNLTADVEHGIGPWLPEDFERALRRGRSPEGRPYYPAFPYTSYTHLSDTDIADLFAYLRTVAPSSSPSPSQRPDLLARRWALWPWRWLHFQRGPQTMERGQYLVDAVFHCGECHTPRNVLGASTNRYLAGSRTGPGAPNLTPHEHGLMWSEADWASFIDLGLTVDGDVPGGEMGDVCARLSDLDASDVDAMASWLARLAPLRTRPAPEPAEEAVEDDPDFQW